MFSVHIKVVGDSRRCRIRRRSRSNATLLSGAAIVGSWLLCNPAALAQVAGPTFGNLTDLMESGVYDYNALEIAGAKANDAAYAALYPACSAPPATGAPAASTCTGNTALLFDRLRELEDTANGLLGRGETTYSLRLGAQAVGFALRWTAPEEYAAQGSLTSKFANSQMTTLAGRFSALRFATQIARLQGGGDSSESDSDGPKFASYSSGTMQGGGASADSSSPFAGSNWGAFANGSYSAGQKAPTTFEDAFNYNDTEYTAGTDVRLNAHIVLGVLAGHTTKNINFDSSESIVDGGIRGEGYSVIVYSQYEGDSAYVNLSLGLQHLSLDTRRAITYPSLNPLIPSVNQTSTSQTTANSWIGNFGTGYSFHWRGFTAEPYLNGQYVNTRIAAFSENGGDGFDFDVGSQSIPSATSSLGLKLQEAFLPPFGVIVPYVYGEYRHEFLEKSRNISTVYAASGLAEASAANFDLPTDEPTQNYYVVGGGITLVLKHGVQGFVQYIKVLNMLNYTDYVASGGIRFEF